MNVLRREGVEKQRMSTYKGEEGFNLHDFTSRKYYLNEPIWMPLLKSLARNLQNFNYYLLDLKSLKYNMPINVYFTFIFNIFQLRVLGLVIVKFCFNPIFNYNVKGSRLIILGLETQVS